LGLSVLAICGCEDSTPATGSKKSLNVEEWSVMSHDEKFSNETLARLRASVPGLEDQGEWQKFLINQTKRK
jgi:hypothetical protein